MKSAFNFDNINLNDIEFKKCNNCVLFNYDNDHLNKLYIETPMLKLNKIEFKKNIIVFLIELENNNFIEFLNNLDLYIIEKSRENHNWFPNENMSFKGLVRHNENTKLIKLKIRSDNLDSLKFTKNNNKINFSDLNVNDEIKLIIDIHGLWINNKSFGIYLKPYLIDVEEKITFNEQSDNLLDSDSDNFDNLEELPNSPLSVNNETL